MLDALLVLYDLRHLYKEELLVSIEALGGNVIHMYHIGCALAPTDACFLVLFSSGQRSKLLRNIGLEKAPQSFEPNLSIHW